MGEVRSAVQERADVAPYSPARGLTGQLVDIEERLHDLIDTKTRDIAREGEAERARNEASKTKLERAAAHIRNAVDELRQY